VLFQKYREIQPVYAKIFDIRTSDRKYEKITGFSGFGSLVLKEEGTPISYEDPVQGYDTTFTHLTYGLGARITMEMTQDDLYNVISRLPAALADAVVRFKDTMAAEIFNNGFSSTGTPFMSGGDGQYLFDTDHPLTKVSGKGAFLCN